MTKRTGPAGGKSGAGAKASAAVTTSSAKGASTSKSAGVAEDVGSGLADKADTQTGAGAGDLGGPAGDTAGSDGAVDSGHAAGSDAAAMIQVGSDATVEVDLGNTLSSDDVVVQGTDDPAPGFLLGTNMLPSMVDIGDSTVQLGEVVRGAKTASGYSSAEWNELQQETRDKHLSNQVERMRAKNKARTPPPKPLYPLTVTFRHNGGLTVTEPATHSVIAPGSSTAVVHSAAQAQLVRENLRAIAAANFWGEGVLSVEGLPE